MPKINAREELGTFHPDLKDLNADKFFEKIKKNWQTDVYHNTALHYLFRHKDVDFILNVLQKIPDDDFFRYLNKLNSVKENPLFCLAVLQGLYKRAKKVLDPQGEMKIWKEIIKKLDKQQLASLVTQGNKEWGLAILAMLYSYGRVDILKELFANISLDARNKWGWDSGYDKPPLSFRFICDDVAEKDRVAAKVFTAMLAVHTYLLKKSSEAHSQTRDEKVDNFTSLLFSLGGDAIKESDRVFAVLQEFQKKITRFQQYRIKYWFVPGVSQHYFNLMHSFLSMANETSCEEGIKLGVEAYLGFCRELNKNHGVQKPSGDDEVAEANFVSALLRDALIEEPAVTIS